MEASTACFLADYEDPSGYVRHLTFSFYQSDCSVGLYDTKGDKVFLKRSAYAEQEERPRSAAPPAPLPVARSRSARRRPTRLEARLTASRTRPLLPTSFPNPAPPRVPQSRRRRRSSSATCTRARR